MSGDRAEAVKFLIVGSIFHPEELRDPADLFPASQDQYFYVRALRALGHEVEAFIRNVPAFGIAATRSASFGRRGIGPLLGKIGAVLAHRVPRAQPDFYARNRRLLAQARRFGPDALILMGGNRVIFPETIQQIKAETGCRVFFLTGDSPLLFSTALERAAAPLYDWAVVNDFYHGIQLVELGAKDMLCLPISACDPDTHYKRTLSAAEQAEYGCEIGFVGTLIPPQLYSERVAALEAVRDMGLGVWSVHAVPGSLQGVYRGAALGEKTLRAICGAKIQVNPHGNSMRYGGNIRLFEAAGCGVFQIADDRPGIPTWFTVGEHLVTYKTPAHLREVAAYYLRHDAEREAMAAAAQAHVYAHHTYRHRMAALAAVL